MTIQELLNEKINVINQENYNICVLKGFSPDNILHLQQNGYEFLDNNYIENGYININIIDFMSLLLNISQVQNDRMYLMTYESLLALYSNVRNLASLNKRICILSNNLFSQYINPTAVEIPDFESNDFMDSDDNNSYCLYYSNCSKENDRIYVEYIDPEEGYESIDIKPFIPVDNNDPELHEANETDLPLPMLATEGGSIDNLLQQLFYNGSIEHSSFLVDTLNHQNGEKISLLLSLSGLLGITIRLYVKTGRQTTAIRQDLYDTLQRVWGYNAFRDLKIYNDLTINRDVSDISQGEIIERVIKQSEYASNGVGLMHNVLLTAPTGAGKSLLFQLAGIYLAERYEKLTIVVSPLVALMEDQVNHLRSRYSAVAALNSLRTPQEKESILDDIENHRINILYVSPELLLSYSINTFLRGREIGLMVIDEAHTVTTWGRDFRVDYWFLGSYLKKSKKYLNYEFPIFALTATAVWDPSGLNDMVFETIDSLNMAPCDKYIGVVRREDITFDIKNPRSETNYGQQRIDLTADFIRETINRHEKAIVYFPYKRDIDNFINNANLQDLEDRIAKYHSGLDSATRNHNAIEFQNGNKIVMMATKAYGMGIDVTDIKTVYHHAPSGSLSDYTQEIGRAARRPDIQGVAKIDFLNNDLKYAKQLFGLSAIKHYQVRGVLAKLMDLYRQKGSRRNMVVSPDDFAYLFPGKNEDYDQKVKSTLLLISNDLQRKLNYNVLIVRPKNIFSKSYVSVPSNGVNMFEMHLANYIEVLDSNNHIYILDCEKLWNKHFSNLTFSQFKYNLASGSLNYNLFPELDRILIINKLDLVLTGNRTVASTYSSLQDFFRISESILGNMAASHTRMALDDIRNTFFAQSNMEYERFIETFNLVYCSINHYCRLHHQNAGDEPTHIQLTNNGYQTVSALFNSLFNNRITTNRLQTYAIPTDNIFILAQILNSLGLVSYERIGGENPSVFIRINNPFYLTTLANMGVRYQNDMLDNIYQKFEVSKSLFIHFFTHSMDNKTRWDFIEDYFLGTPVSTLLQYGV